MSSEMEWEIVGSNEGQVTQSANDKSFGPYSSDMGCVWKIILFGVN